MTKEQEAIEYLKESVLIYKNTIPKISESIGTVLSMLKEKDKEIEKLKEENKNIMKLNANMSKRHLDDIFKIKRKDKIIDLMAEKIDQLGSDYDDFCIDTIWNEDCDEDCKNCIKQYFERKSEE